MEIICARTPADLDDLRTLMRGLAAHFSTLGMGECPADAFDAEIEGPESHYDEPAGRMVLARDGSVPVGCAMMRALPDGTCEVRRVFVVPAARRKGVARSMMVRMMAEARDAGYDTMRLVTGAGFSSAIALYEGLGFRRVPCYRPTTWTDVACMEADL